MEITEVSKFVKSVMSARFPGIHDKQTIDESDGKLNFACPFCGDSKVKASKKRGHLYMETKTYKCFNDGCMAWMSLAEFVASLSNQYGIISSLFLDEADLDINYKKTTENHLVRFLTSNRKGMISISDVINRFSLKRLDQISENSAAYTFAQSRGLTKVKNFGDIMYADAMDNKVYIFNFDHRSGKILGLATRSLDPFTDRKYLIKSYNEVSKIFTNGDTPEIIDDANYLNNYFNILNVDFTQPLMVAEGQIDSMFLKNGLATSGVSKAKSILKAMGAVDIKIIFDRDKAGKDSMLAFIKDGYSVFLWNSLMDELKKKFPTQIIKLSKIKDINDLFLFLNKQDPSFTISQFQDLIGKHFSNSVYDIIYL